MAKVSKIFIVFAIKIGGIAMENIPKNIKKNKQGVPILSPEQALKVMGSLVCQTCGTKLIAKNELGIYCPKCSIV